MLRKSVHRLQDLKEFSQNHSTNELTLKCYGSPCEDTSVEYKVELTEDKLKKIIDFLEGEING